ncbi:MAG: sulfatase-like hydrolase/transferase [Ectothiorhodospiraceae bacterium]|nr:sulfatase-like hydrolase/transferase [Ectothiorhodospiraceae bacterium]
MNERSRPNILWYCTDQQRFDTIGALGNPHVSTPTIDSLVESGVAFTRAYTQSPICTPSRASFLTGHYPSTVHVNRNGNETFPDRPKLVPRLLADAGYDCGLIGKLHLTSAYRRLERRVDDGYRFYKWSHAPRDNWPEGHDYADWVHAKGESLAELSSSFDGVPASLHQTTWAADRAIEFINEPRRGPWLLSINVYDPHPPFNPPLAYRELFDPATMPDPLFRDSDLETQARLAVLDFQSRARHPRELDIHDPVVPVAQEPGYRPGDRGPGPRDAWTLKAWYYAMIKLIDDQLARILQCLRDSGQLESTVVIFSTDHGESLGDHGLIEKGCRFYEGLVHVPLIVSWPGQFRAGLRADALVELQDQAPTILELAGVSLPETMQGRSLLPILRGDAAPDHHRDFVRSEYYDAIWMSDASHGTMYFDGRHKLVVYHNHDLGELYDLREDPGEFVNLWDEPDCIGLKARLLKRSFDASVMAIDQHCRRIGPM